MDCQLDKGLPPDVDYMAVRRAEDAKACRLLNAKPVWLPFAEAPHRGYGDARSLFGPPRATDDVAERVAGALEEMLSSKPDLLLGPQAIGGHVDHVQVVHALSRVLPRDIPILWWVDFPYAARRHSHPSRPFEDTMEKLPELLIDADMPARENACAAYATQIGFQFGGTEGLTRALSEAGPVEHFRMGGGRSALSLLAAIT